MKNFLITDGYVEASRTDASFRLSITGMLELIEDVVTLHTNEMHVDAPTLYKEDNAFWVIARSCLHIERTPVWQEKIVVGTHPLPPMLTRCERQSYITDKSGNLLVSSKTDWCALDAETRRPRAVSSLKSYPSDMQHRTDRVYSGSLSVKMPDFSENDAKLTQVMRYSDLDFNHHVNNTKYVNFIYDCYPSSFWDNAEIGDVRIDYLHELKEGETLTVYSVIDGKTVFFKGATKEKHIFSAVLVLK